MAGNDFRKKRDVTLFHMRYLWEIRSNRDHRIVRLPSTDHVLSKTILSPKDTLVLKSEHKSLVMRPIDKC